MESAACSVPLAGHPLSDPRVRWSWATCARSCAASPGRFDAVLLDVDNGPEAFATSANGGLYGDTGLFATRTALKFGGTLAVWSAWADRHFPHRLRYAGFTVKDERVRTRHQARRHTAHAPI